jgi:hypothetical protein
MIRRFGLRVGTWMVAGALMAMLAAACGATSHVTTPRTGPGYRIFTMRLLRENHAPDRGVLTHSAISSLQVRQTTSFEVEITGVGKGPDVVTGGFVSVRSMCSGGLTCTPRSSSAPRAIPGPGRSATWRWEVAAISPGQAQILLLATSYSRRSKTALRETSVVIHLTVLSTPLYVLEHYFDSHDRVIGLLAAGLLVVAAAVGVALALLRKVGSAGAGAASARVGHSEADTEPLRTHLYRKLPIAFPAVRQTQAWRTLLWLLPIDVAAGGLAIWIVRSSISASIGVAVIVGAAVILALPLYFLPVIIAYLRPAPDRVSVAIVSIFLGWTYVGWVVALAMAVRDRQPAIVVMTERGHARARKHANTNPLLREGGPAVRGQDSPARTRA